MAVFSIHNQDVVGCHVSLLIMHLAQPRSRFSNQSQTAVLLFVHDGYLSNNNRKVTV